MSLSRFHESATSPGCALKNDARSESTVAPLTRAATEETRTFPPARTSPAPPFRWRRLESEFSRTCASLNACFGTSNVIATAENGDARSPPQALSARAIGSDHLLIRAQPS